MTQRNIVVTGATGNIGGRVARELARQAKAGITAFVRDPTRAHALASAGVTLRRGSFEDTASLREAFAGADTVVLITSGATLAAQAQAAFDVARAVGIRKVVRVSSLKADVAGPTDATHQDGRAETALRDSGLTHVILRGHCFMQNLFHNLGSLRAEGRLYAGMGNGRIGMIDSRDIADAAVAAATQDTWDGRTFELTGPAALTYHDVAASLGRELGREITYVPVSPEAAGETALKHGADPWVARVLSEYSAAYTNGWGDFTTPDVSTLTGHAPRSISEFAREVLLPALRAG
ncbi:NAD(P)H-binding protein [Myxococcus stipitatus]|uniref:NAD(P)H-binding protein n=1 Tax=Myxococcus stipitatus TaxID=83455 RepID=UPI001F430248|nr:NAD(P)H-binding protein [Myxococcus stipitatus]MCE9670852.1 NAD(P)H-binding protein [Myxococcus stipitatus]